MIRFLRRKGLHRHTANYEGVLGTSLEIDLVSGDEAAGGVAEGRILAEIDRLEAIFSVYQPDSEFNRWQKTQSTAIVVSADLAFVLAEAERWRELSDGAFLPTVEALTRAWRNREARGKESNFEGLGAGRVVGETDTEMMRLDPTEPIWRVDLESLTATRLTKHPASLNAIAKGYIVDRAVEVAREVDSVRQAMVNIGGDLRHWGDGATQVAVADPTRPADNAPPLTIVKLSNQAVATSGGYKRGFQIDEARYSHIFDPAVAEPIQMLRSASIIAPTAMLADIFATIVGVLPPNVGLAFADRQDSVGALVVDSAGNCRQNAYWDGRRVAI